MSLVIGYKAKVEVSEDDGATYVEVGRVTSATFGHETELSDSTSNSDGGYSSKVYAITSGTLDVSLKWEASDPGQVICRESKFARTVLKFRFQPEQSAGQLQYDFDGLISSMSLDTSTNEVQDFSFTVESTGVISQSTQV